MNTEELESISIKLAEEYKKIAIECVKIKNIFPPNRYTFTTKFFRKIKGWDNEWYDVMYGWMNILNKDGWEVQFLDKAAGERYFQNFQYMYNEILPTYNLSIEINDIDKVIDFKRINETECNQSFLFDREIKIPNTN